MMKPKSKKLTVHNYRAELKALDAKVSKLLEECEAISDSLPYIEDEDVEFAASCDFVVNSLSQELGKFDDIQGIDVRGWAAQIAHQVLLNDLYTERFLGAVAQEISEFHCEDSDYPEIEKRFALACRAALFQCAAAMREAYAACQQECDLFDQNAAEKSK